MTRFLNLIASEPDIAKAPIMLDSSKWEIIAAGLKCVQGKPIINSVNGMESSLREILPLVKEYGTAVIGLTMDEAGVALDADKRVALAHKIVDAAARMGIPREDVIIDCLCTNAGANGKAGVVALEAILRIRKELEVNQTLRASDISYGLPDLDLLASTFVTNAITAGVTCPVVDVSKVLSTVVATDYLLGRDDHGTRYIRTYRKLQGDIPRSYYSAHF
jgi:5-methyltetrahydrofolate--homocysteine methyltransferase